jgi:hypothetical protein
MDHAIDALIEIFTWVGFGGFLVLAIAVVIAWAADGTWLPAEAIIDRDGGDPSSAGSTQTATPTVRRCPRPTPRSSATRTRRPSGTATAGRGACACSGAPPDCAR